MPRPDLRARKPENEEIRKVWLHEMMREEYLPGNAAGLGELLMPATPVQIRGGTFFITSHSTFFRGPRNCPSACSETLLPSAPLRPPCTTTLHPRALPQRRAKQRRDRRCAAWRRWAQWPVPGQGRAKVQVPVRKGRKSSSSSSCKGTTWEYAPRGSPTTRRGSSSGRDWCAS